MNQENYKNHFLYNHIRELENGKFAEFLKGIESRNYNVVYFYLNNPENMIDVNAVVNGTPLINKVLTLEPQHENIIWLFLNYNINFDVMDNATKSNPLHIACQYASINIINYILINGTGINFNARNKFNMLPIHVAAKRGDLNIINKIIRYNPDICKQDSFGLYPIHYAMCNDTDDDNKVKIIKSFVNYSGLKSIDIPTSDGLTIFDMALRCKNKKVIDYVYYRRRYEKSQE